MAVRFLICVLLVASAACPCALLPSGDALAEELVPTAEETRSLAKAQVGERWYGIYIFDQKVGWQRDSWEESGEQICNEIEFSLKMAFLGQTSTITVRERGCYEMATPFPLATYRSTRNEEGRIVTLFGKREKDELVYEIDTGTQKRTVTAPLDSDLLSYALAWAPMARMKEGDVVKSFTFDELTAKKTWQRYSLVSREEKTLMGKKQTVFKMLVEDEMGMKLDALISAEGIILEGSVGPSMRIVLEDKNNAIRTDVALLDLYSSSFVKATGEIDYLRATAVKRLKLKLTGSGPLALPPSTARQTVAAPEGTSTVVEVTACPAPDPKSKPDEKARACNADVPCDVAQYKTQAEEIAGKAGKDLDRAKALSRWVNDNFKYKLGSGGSTADVIIKEKTGDCTEYAKALLLLLRAAGIPARLLSGVVLASQSPLSFGYHAWVEAHLDGHGWVQLDPTWGQFPVDATHIVFDVDEGLQMLAHIGGLSIDVLDVEYAPAGEALKCD